MKIFARIICWLALRSKFSTPLEILTVLTKDLRKRSRKLVAKEESDLGSIRGSEILIGQLSNSRQDQEIKRLYCLWKEMIGYEERAQILAYEVPHFNSGLVGRAEDHWERVHLYDKGYTDMIYSLFKLAIARRFDQPRLLTDRCVIIRICKGWQVVQVP